MDEAVVGAFAIAMMAASVSWNLPVRSAVLMVGGIVLISMAAVGVYQLFWGQLVIPVYPEGSGLPDAKRQTLLFHAAIYVALGLFAIGGAFVASSIGAAIRRIDRRQRERN